MAGGEVETSLITPAEEARFPLVAACAEGAAGKLPLKQRGLRLSRPGVKVTAFGPNPDGEGLVLRLWEQAGHSGTLGVELPGGLKVKSVQPVDLRGRSSAPSIPLEGGRFETPLGSFEPRAFLLNPSE